MEKAGEGSERMPLEGEGDVLATERSPGPSWQSRRDRVSRHSWMAGSVTWTDLDPAELCEYTTTGWAAQSKSVMALAWGL